MNDLYQKIIIKDGNRHTSITREEAIFLYNFVKKQKLKKTLEIGLAYAVSALHIMEGSGGVHTAIDPFQGSEKYQNTGLKNVRRLGLESSLKFYNEYSAAVLPELWKKGTEFDLVFMDGSHFFDDIFVDFYFIDKLLMIDGFVIMHDAWTPQIKTLKAWIETNKINYRQIKNTRQNNFLIWQKVDQDKRKWFDFKKFEVDENGTISCYM